MGLFDMVMIKDNHISAAGGVTNALRAVDLYLEQKNLKVEVEVVLWFIVLHNSFPCLFWGHFCTSTFKVNENCDACQVPSANWLVSSYCVLRNDFLSTLQLITNCVNKWFVMQHQDLLNRDIYLHWYICTGISYAYGHCFGLFIIA